MAKPLNFTMHKNGIYNVKNVDEIHAFNEKIQGCINEIQTCSIRIS